eukprot:UN02982
MDKDYQAQQQELIRKKKEPQLLTIDGRTRLYVEEDKVFSTVIATSVGQGSDYFIQTTTPSSITSSNNNNTTDSMSKCIHFWTQPIVWTIGILLGWATCFYCCWHRRFTQLIYHSEYLLILPDITEFSAIYATNPDRFEFQGPLDGPAPQAKLKYNSSPQTNSSKDNGNNDNITCSTSSSQQQQQ